MRNFVFLFFICLPVVTVLNSGCSSKGDGNKSSKKAVDKKQPVQEKKKADPLNTKKGMEGKLSQLGITIYPGAKFKSVNFKYNNYGIVYDVPLYTEESKNKIDDYYKPILKKLEEKGWEKIVNNPEIFKKGNESISFAHAFNSTLRINRIIFSYSGK